MAMFPQFGAAPGAPSPGGPAPLLSFKAGKMELKDMGNDTFHVTPDTRKGTVSLFKGPDDQLMHFGWKERPANMNSGRPVDDIIILPEEAVYKKVDTGHEGERVFILEIAGNRRFFYWMQDKSSDKDEENTKKVNSLINFPPSEDASAARGAAGSPDMMDFLGSMAGAGMPPGAGRPAGGSTAGHNELGLRIENLQSILQDMGFSPQQQAAVTGVAAAEAPQGTATATPAGGVNPGVAQAIAALGAATAAAGAPVATPAPAGDTGGGGSGGGLTAADFRRAMMDLSGTSARAQDPPVALTDVVNADIIDASGILDDPEVQQRLLPLLPEGQQTEEELREIIRSPQLRHTLGSLSNALQTGSFNNIMSSFELDPSNPRSAEAMARGDPTQALLQALMHEAEVKREREAAEAAEAPEAAGQEEESKDTMDADD